MDKLDRAFEEIKQTSAVDGSTNILILAVETKTVDSIRASLEVSGFCVSQVSTIDQFEESIGKSEYDLIITTTSTKVDWQHVFELVSLLTPHTPVVGFSESTDYNKIVDFIRFGGVDCFSLPDDLELIASRAEAVVETAKKQKYSSHKANSAINLCRELNEERHRVVEENNTLCNDLANNHCDEKKRMQQVAIGAEFQALISQELDVESMLRTALGYTLTRVGAFNAAVYLREGDMDWGIGAFVNYDRQDDQFQSLIDELGPAVCPLMSSEPQLKRYTDGESFAELLGLDPLEFSGTGVVVFGCYHKKRCMAIMVLFRGDSKPFTKETTETLDTLRSIFGQQLGKILSIHRRGKTQWPSESIDDDDWSLGKAA